jgi:hypothetical protein
MSMWTRNGIRCRARSVDAESGSTSVKLPPAAKRTSSSPRPAASSISGVVIPGSEGTSKPHCWLSFAALSSSTASPPGKEVA